MKTTQLTKQDIEWLQIAVSKVSIESKKRIAKERRRWFKNKSGDFYIKIHQFIHDKMDSIQDKLTQMIKQIPQTPCTTSNYDTK